MRRKLRISQVDVGITEDELAQRIHSVYEYLMTLEAKDKLQEKLEKEKENRDG